MHSEWLAHTKSFRTEITRAGRLAAAALDLFLPPGCILCSGQVDAPGLLCGTCFGQLSTIGAPFCDCCGVPFEQAWHAIDGGLCQRCIDTPPTFEHARAGLRYDAASRRLVLPFKHGDRIEFAGILARQMAIAGEDLLRRSDVLIPVPLHRRRLFVRRYNQSALLALSLGRIASRPVLVDGLMRLHATHSLDGKSAAERHQEVASAFAARSKRVWRFAGRRVLLIDDVMTSGATAAACGDALLAAGAGSVDVLVALRVPDPRLRPTVPRPYRRRKRLTQPRQAIPSPALSPSGA